MTMVYHVIQKVSNNHNTSYKTGTHWIESHDKESTATARSDTMNYHRSPQCIGVEYSVIGPIEETEPVTAE